MAQDREIAGVDFAGEDDRPPHLRQRFRDFAESEHLRLLQTSYLIGAVLFFAALVGEHFAFGHRFGLDDVAATCLFVLAQIAFLGWRVAARLPSLRPEGRAAIIVANGWMWALLSVVHTTVADAAPYVYELVLIQIVFCYFFSGLAQRVAIVSGLLIGLALPAMLLTVGTSSSEAIARGAFVRVAMNAVGCAGLYALADRLHETTREISMRFGEGEAGLAGTSASLGVLVVRKPDPRADFGQLLDRADGLSMMVKRIGGRAMILREWEEPKRLRTKAIPEPDSRPRFRVGAA